MSLWVETLEALQITLGVGTLKDIVTITVKGIFFTTPHFHLELVEALFLILNEQVGGEFEKLYLYMTLGWVNCGTAISYTPMKYFSISFLEHQFDFKNKSSTNRKKTRQYKNS